MKPDILFITGDFLGNGRGDGVISEYKAFVDIIKQIKTSIGIFGILGNYDGYIADYRHPERLKELRWAGIDILRNENRRLVLPNKKSLWIVGSQYEKHNDYSDSYFKKSMMLAPHDAPVIMLNHYPDVFDKAFSAGINLVLTGHTHGGQIGIPFLIQHSNSANKSQFLRGLFDSGKTKMYVNRGIGTTNMPVRFLCRPEITVFEFVRKPEH